jgi:hypothetical protein
LGVGGCACVSVVETQAQGFQRQANITATPISLTKRLSGITRLSATKPRTLWALGKDGLLRQDHKLDWQTKDRSLPETQWSRAVGFSSVFTSRGYRTPTMALTPQTLLTELDTTLSEVSQDWRTTVLGQIADLFLNDAHRYSNDQVALFDTVMSLLLPGVDRLTLAQLSNRLADLANPPAKVMASLASHADADVCGPVLERAKALPDKILVEAVERERIDPKIPAIIAARPELAAAVTDCLLKRGNAAIQRTLLQNPDARISEGGFARIIMGLDGDVSLAELVAARADLPAELRPWLNDLLKS